MLNVLLLILAAVAHAGRPLITDDASVIGHKALQLETWIFGDDHSVQHWVVPTIGFKDTVEFSAAGVQGIPLEEEHKRYSISGPILQSKVKIAEEFAIAGGTIASYGNGDFKTEHWDYFYYLVWSTKYLHVNLGQQTRRNDARVIPTILWGVALEVPAHGNWTYFVEAANGEVYAIIPGVAVQVGFKHDFTDTFQLDGTIGRGVTGDPLLPLWATLGVKLLY